MWNTWCRVCRSPTGTICPACARPTPARPWRRWRRRASSPTEDYTRLRKAHTFLRWLIDSLRVVRGNAKDVTMPRENTEEMAFLARRMNFANAPLRLHTELMRYAEDVRELNNRLLTLYRLINYPFGYWFFREYWHKIGSNRMTQPTFSLDEALDRLSRIVRAITSLQKEDESDINAVLDRIARNAVEMIPGAVVTIWSHDPTQG